MRKFVSFSLVALVGMTIVMACVKKSAPITTNSSPITVIVMDSTQALLPYVEVKCGKTVLKTSYDGRVVLTPEMTADVKKIEITAEDFESLKVTLAASDGQPLLVTLSPKKNKSKHDHVIAYGKPTLRSEKAAKSADVSVEDEVEADYVYDEEPVAYLALESAAVSADMKASGYGMAAPSSNNIKAGKLTAGEVNDFTKWYFWPTIIDSTHKAFVQTWKMQPRQRYTVQIMNIHGYPIVNYPVSLTDQNGNTLYQALTDNTGKAELWGNLIVDRQQSTIERFFINGKPAEVWQTIVVEDPCETPEGVDVLFVFDATGSMGDELRYMQAEMKDVIARAKDATGGLKIRTGAVVYRDHGDDYITRISRLTEEIKTTQNFIDKQEASGGGDFPEAVPEALMAALNSAGWDESARARIAFLILDAPCHHDSATLALLHDQILNAAAQGVRVVPVVCSGLDDAGEFLMRSIALATNGTSFFLTDDSGIGNKHHKPTTDSLKVEHLNDMLVRTIVEFSAMPDCKEGVGNMEEEITGEFIPNPFDAKDIEADPSIPHGEGVHYLVDMSGKLIAIIEGDIDQVSATNYQLPIGVYFIKTFYNGQWFTKKILAR